MIFLTTPRKSRIRYCNKKGLNYTSFIGYVDCKNALALKMLFLTILRKQFKHFDRMIMTDP